MSLGKRRKKILDGEQLFNHYFLEMGDGRSHNKLSRWASSKWGKNPETGRDWTTGAVWQSMWRWAFENLPYAKKVYQEVSFNFFLKVTKVENPDVVWSDQEFEDEWKETVARHAKTCMTKTQYARFLRGHPEFQPYEITE